MRPMDLRAKDSLAKAIEDLAKKPKPPASFDERHVAIFEQIVNSRAAAEWKGIDNHFAVELTQAIIDLEDERVLLKAEGSITLNRFGVPVPNPRVVIINNLRTAVLRLEGRLMLAGERHEASTSPQRKSEKQLDVIEDTSDNSDGLVPTMATITPSRFSDDGLLPRFGPRAVKQ